jgi:hypothetical protein
VKQTLYVKDEKKKLRTQTNGKFNNTSNADENK